MKFLSTTALFFTLFFVIPICINAQSLTEVRKVYMEGLHNLDSVPKVYNYFVSMKEPSAKESAYKGAIQAIMTKTTWNLFKKMNYLRASEKSFEAAVTKAPNDVEIRFMRMAVQFEIPSYLGMSEDMEADRKFIIDHIKEFDISNFPAGTLEEIFRFMKRCDKFTAEQIETFKGILAQN